MNTQLSLAKNVNENKNEIAVSAVATAVVSSTSSAHVPQVREQNVSELDVIGQLRANLQQLEELNSRLGFMVSEVAGLVKRK